MKNEKGMTCRRFGKTGLKMPVLSCGGMRFQHKWKDVPPDRIPRKSQENLEAAVRRALELGVNHIETARGYGTSEMQLGAILPGLPRRELIVQTKVQPEKNPEDFLKTFDKSMEYLKLDHLDLFALHGVNNDELVEWSLRKGGCLEAALKLKEEGRVRHLGFSSHGSARQILRMIETDAFDYVNLHWYYIYQFNAPAIDAAARRDMGVFVISPTDKGGMLFKPPEKLRRLCEPLTPIAFNDLFCLSRPDVHTLSVGAARPEDFDEHVEAVARLEEWKSAVRDIAARLDRELKEVLGENWAENWPRGLPEYPETPGNVNVPVILWLRNLALAFDMIDYGKMRYNLIGNADHWFPGRQAGDLDGLDLADCLSGSPFREVIPALLAETHALLGGKREKRLSQREN